MDSIKTKKTIILTREDLRRWKGWEKILIEDIEFESFSVPRKTFLEANTVVFIDKNYIKILKNRDGKPIMSFLNI
jgi:hypothetical protein